VPTNFPGALDDFEPNPTPNSSRKSPSLSGKVTTLSDAVLAIEETVGVIGSAEPTSLQYRVDALESGGSVIPASQPGLNNFHGWTFDPIFAQTGYGPPSGTLVLGRVAVSDATISNVVIRTNSGGSGVTGAYVALYTAAGALLAQSASFHAAIPVAVISVPLLTPQVVAAGEYYAAAWFVGATPPQLMIANADPAGVNATLVAPNLRSATANTGLTTTAPPSFGAQVALRPVFFAVS
jgi:hypothetical protein